MRTPLSLRVARLLLIGAAAASLGVIAYVVNASSEPRRAAPWLALHVLVALAFIGAAARVGRDPRQGRLLALAGALGLGGLGVLEGWGAGNVSLPAAALGVLAAWAAALAPPSRALVIAFVAYVVVGLVVSGPQLRTAVAFPWLGASVLLWPWTLFFRSPALASVPIFGSLGASLALLVLAAARAGHRDAERAVPARLGLRRTLFGALVGGVAVVAIHVGLALARPETSARFELELLPLAILFGAGAALGIGLATLRAARPLASGALALGGAVVLYALAGGPAVECRAGGMSTRAGPWWLPSSGQVMSSGGGGPGGQSGEIRRDDLVVRFRCEGSTVTEFRIERR